MSAKHHNGTQSGTVTDDSMQQLLDDVFEFNNSGKGLAVTKIRGHLVHHLYELRQNYFILSCLYCVAEVATALDCSFDLVLQRDKLTQQESALLWEYYSTVAVQTPDRPGFNTIMENYNFI